MIGIISSGLSSLRKCYCFLVNILTANLRQDLKCDEEVTLRIIIGSIFQASETTWAKGTCVEINKCNQRLAALAKGCLKTE